MIWRASSPHTDHCLCVPSCSGSFARPLPITVGTHTREYTEANAVRALVNNAALLQVTLPKESVPNTAQVFGERKCSSADNKGRWLDLDVFGNVCEPPVCTGPTKTTIHDVDWVCIEVACVVTIALSLLCPISRSTCACHTAFLSQNGDTSRHWVFVPYDCYYHLYDREGLYRCAAETNTNWILSMGDSQEREFVAIMKNINGSMESATKFEEVSGGTRG
jgi:hypothetical protein